MPGPGTARKFKEEELYFNTTPASKLEVVETHKKTRANNTLLGFLRLVIALALVSLGIVLVVILSYYIMMFHTVNAEGLKESSFINEVGYMKQYSEYINIYDIGKSYYPVVVKVER